METNGFDEAEAAVRRRVADAAMEIAAREGWRRVGPVAVADAAGLGLAAFYRRFPERGDLLAAVSRIADEAVLAGDAEPSAEESARDRLFDVMMRRFDALLPFREGLAAVHRDLRREPLTALAFAGTLRRSMAWMLRAARLDADGAAAPLSIAGLCAVYARVFPVWLTDDTPDLARTMAALDGALRRVEGVASALRRAGARRTAGRTARQESTEAAG